MRELTLTEIQQITGGLIPGIWDPFPSTILDIPSTYLDEFIGTGFVLGVAFFSTVGPWLNNIKGSYGQTVLNAYDLNRAKWQQGCNWAKLGAYAWAGYQAYKHTFS